MPLLAGTALQYYFTVNTRYVRNKLKVLLFPFTLRGHWNRTLEQVRNGAAATASRSADARTAGGGWHEIQAAHQRHQRA